MYAADKHDIPRSQGTGHIWVRCVPWVQCSVGWL